MYLSLLDLMRQRGGPLITDPPLLTPQWEESAATLTMRFRLPGIDPKTVQVQVAEGALAIAGSRAHQERIEAEGFFRLSSSVGAFARTFRLPCRVVPRLTTVSWRTPEELEIRLTKA